MTGFSILDLIIAILLLYFILRGYKKGFIQQTSTILGLLIALYMAIRLYQSFTIYLEPYLDLSYSLLNFISFAIIFIVFNIVIHILGVVAKNILKLIFLEPLDHVAGAALGMIKGGLLAYLLVLFLSEIPYTQVNNFLDNSLLASNIRELSPVIHQSIRNLFYRP